MIESIIEVIAVTAWCVFSSYVGCCLMVDGDVKRRIETRLYEARAKSSSKGIEC